MNRGFISTSYFIANFTQVCGRVVYSMFVVCKLSKIYFIANFTQVVNIDPASILKWWLIYLALFKPLDSLEIGKPCYVRTRSDRLVSLSCCLG